MSLELTIAGFLLVAACICFVAIFLKAFYNKKFTKALFIKGIASLCFVSIGAMTCFSNNELSIIYILIFIGLCFGLMGDEVIALCQVDKKHDTLFFIGGGSCFVVGHALYIISLFLINGINWISLGIAFVIIALLSGIYARYKQFLTGDMKIPLAIYLIIVIFMAALAVGVFFNRLSLGTGLFALGGVLFALSDNVLFAYKLGVKPGFYQNIIIHASYYSAQLLIAWSIPYL